MNKVLGILLVGLFLLTPHSRSDVLAFEFRLDGWREFQFGEGWPDAKKKQEDACHRLDSYGDNIFGFDCGKWLQLDVDVRIFADEGSFLGFGKKLDSIQVSTMFSDFAANQILNHLRGHFELTKDYCWSKEEDTNWCSIIFKNGAVVFEDRLAFGKRKISVSLRPYEIYNSGALN